MKLLIIISTLLMLSACGDFNDRTNELVINKHRQSCIDSGYTAVSITYIAGMASSYYTCLGKKK